MTVEQSERPTDDAKQPEEAVIAGAPELGDGDDAAIETAGGTADGVEAEVQTPPAIGKVLVVGAGVAGIRAALDLAESGYKVTLTESSPAIGGILAKLDYQFPTDHCGMCKMLPVVGREAASEYCMRKGLFHENVEILPFTDVTAIDGEPGAFSVTLKRHARYVDPDVCIGTGRCVEVCPVTVADEFNQGLTTRKAVFRPVPHNSPNNYVIDTESCTRCGECVEICPVGAIDLDVADQQQTIETDAVIFAAGSGIYAPSGADRRNYSASPNVVTSLEFERLLSGTGRYDKFIPRPSDGKPARRIAWLQCVGSRNPKEGKDYCSSICCMFALKEAALANEKGGDDIETTIFYMDLRAFGKHFHRYREQAIAEHGIKLVRSRVHSIEPAPDGSLRIRHLDHAGRNWRESSFDIVVLSTGQVPAEGTKAIGEMIGVAPTQMGFIPTSGVDKVRAGREGVYMCGSFSGLTDISDALVSGSSAAGAAARMLDSLGRTAEQQEPAEGIGDGLERQHAAVHVLLCGYDKTRFDFELVSEQIGGRHGIGSVDVVKDVSNDEGLEAASELLAGSSCNRLLLAGVLPLGRRRDLVRIAREHGFRSALIDIVDLGAVVTADNGVGIAEAVTQIIVAAERLKAAELLASKAVPMVQRALVVGGGIGGMRAALSLADRGIDVDLVEQADRLGGWAARRVHYTIDGLKPAEILSETIERTEGHDKIAVHLGAEVAESSGSIGGFRSVITAGDERIEVVHGATIIATGGHEATTSEYSYEASETIKSQSELEAALHSGELDARGLGTVVMIQCVGSREQGAHDYCSRVCCPAALKNALKIRELNPDARVVILYRDLMTYGFAEQYFTKARKAGVIFARFDRHAKPDVELVEAKPVVRFVDHVLQQPVEVSADLLALSVAVEPSATAPKLATAFGIEVDEDGFFQEAESKWRPVDFLKSGMFLAGTAHGPAPMVDVVAQAEAAAQRAYAYLSKETVLTPTATSKVRDANCARCQLCVAVCPFDARYHDTVYNRIIVDAASCQGCGLCAASCPNKAAAMLGMNEKLTMAEISAQLEDA